MADERVVILRGEPIIDEKLEASASITPGMLVEIASGALRPHASSASFAARIFALERDELGDDIDEAYDVGDTVKACYPAPGDRINAIIPSGQNISMGARVESNGDGKVKAGTTAAIGIAAEDSGAVTVDTRLAIIII